MFLLLQVQETSLQQLTQVPKISHFHYTIVLAARIILLFVRPAPFLNGIESSCCRLQIFNVFLYKLLIISD